MRQGAGKLYDLGALPWRMLIMQICVADERENQSGAENMHYLDFLEGIARVAQELFGTSQQEDEGEDTIPLDTASQFAVAQTMFC